MRMLTVVMIMFGAACGGASTGEPLAPNKMSGEIETKTDTPEQPENPSTAPNATSPDASAASSQDSDQIIRHYAIEGDPVDQATYEALFNRLKVDATPYSGETVENPDGSYGGGGEVFHARDGDILYRYEFHTYPRDDGKVGESYMLFRETAP